MTLIDSSGPEGQAADSPPPSGLLLLPDIYICMFICVCQEHILVQNYEQSLCQVSDHLFLVMLSFEN